MREPFSDGRRVNENGGYRPGICRNARNTEQICIRVFLEAAVGRTQIPPRPVRPRDKILRGFLCGVHRFGNAARSRQRVAAGTQHAPALAITARVTGRQPAPFPTACAAMRWCRHGSKLCGSPQAACPYAYNTHGRNCVASLLVLHQTRRPCLPKFRPQFCMDCTVP